MSYCKTILLGNLTRDPECRYGTSGTAICKFSVAVGFRYKKKNGEMAEENSFIDCTAFGMTAENISKYFKKGKPIFIDGRLKMESWEDKQTQQKRSKLVVIVESFQFCEKRSGEADPQSGRDPANAPAQQPEDDQTPPF